MASLPDYFKEARKHHNAQRFAEAETLYRRVVDTEPSHVGAWHHLGLVCMAQEKLPAALHAFEQALDIAPDHVETLTQLGIVLARQKGAW
jgi:cytochrome c-type biogenesis protein CcmH/NrfG